MKNICNNCGAIIPDGATRCPKCDAPSANAPTESDKKFWERDNLVTEEPPEFHPEEESSQTPPPITPPVAPPAMKTPQKESNTKKVMLIVIPIIAILLLLYVVVMFVAKKNHHKGQFISEREAIAEQEPQVEVKVLTGEEADSMMQASMAEFAEADSMMNAMMQQMMGGDPFAAIEQEMMGGGESAPSHQQTQPSQQKSKNGILNLAGRIGDKDIVMVLNTKDPQNLKGTAKFVGNGQTKESLHVLGIGSGNELTVSIYDAKNNVVGNLAGTYDGYYYSGTCEKDGKEIPFRLAAQ